MNGLHQPLAEAMRAIRFVNEDIAQIRKDRVIGDNARKADLFFLIVQAKDERIGKRTFDAFARASLRPIGAREKFNNCVDVEADRIRADDELIPPHFDDFLHGASLSWVIDSPIVVLYPVSM